MSLSDEEIGSYNSQKLCYVCKKTLHDVDDSNDDDDKFDAWKFHGDVASFNDVDDYYNLDDGGNGENFGAGKFHVHAAGTDYVDSYDEKFDGIRFMVPAKNMKECIITAIMQGNTKGLHILSAI